MAKKSSKNRIRLFLISLVTLITALEISNGQSPDFSSLQADLPNNICHNNSVIIKEISYKTYYVKISRDEEHLCRSIEIERDGQLAYRDEEIGTYYFPGADFEEIGNPFVYLTNQDEPYLVFSKWTGGMHCCYSLHIFKIADDFKKIAEIDGGNFYPVLMDINNDGILEIEVTDDFLAYQFSSFAFSATGKVILKFSEDSYHVAPEYMIKSVPDLNNFNNQISSWKNKFHDDETGESPPPSLVQVITDLVFSGNKQTAFHLVDRSWPPNLEGKKEFLDSYEQTLRTSRFYREFEELL